MFGVINPIMSAFLLTLAYNQVDVSFNSWVQIRGNDNNIGGRIEFLDGKLFEAIEACLVSVREAEKANYEWSNIQSKELIFSIKDTPELVIIEFVPKSNFERSKLMTGGGKLCRFDKEIMKVVELHNTL